MGSGNDQLWSHRNGWRWRVLDNYVIMPITINGSGTVTGIAVGGLPDGIVDGGTLASGTGGKILQYVTATDTTQNTTSTTDWEDTGLSVTITPTSSSSKILIMVHQVFKPHTLDSGTSNTVRSYVRIMRGTTSILQFQDGGLYQGDFGDQMKSWHASAPHHIDEPNTTSATVYKTAMKVDNNTDTIGCNNDGNPGRITVMELAA